MSVVDVTAPQPRPKRGLLDAVLLALLLFGVYAKTPIGALAETGVRVALGDPHRPSLFASFRGRETEVRLSAPQLETGLLASLTFPDEVVAASKRTGVDPELLVSLISASGGCNEKGCTLKTPPHLGDLLDAPDQPKTSAILPVAIALGIANEQLGDLSLAVEALYVGVVPAQRARDQARATGLDFPEEIESHATFYSPMIRRGVLQEALAVLALHRLRTLAWPADPRFRISSPFGERVHPVLGTKRFHNGVDLAVPTGTPLFSPAKVKVRRASRDSVSGNYLKISHGFGIESTFCHMSLLDVSQGARVERKARVGLSGATGRVTGPHLHYILRIAGKAVDPEKYGYAPTRKRGGAPPPNGASTAAAPTSKQPPPPATRQHAKSGSLPSSDSAAKKQAPGKTHDEKVTTRPPSSAAADGGSTRTSPSPAAHGDDRATTTPHAPAPSLDDGGPPTTTPAAPSHDDSGNTTRPPDLPSQPARSAPSTPASDGGS